MVLLFMYFFFFKQKTAYEMRISDWSSDVCSSDLAGVPVADIGCSLFATYAILAAYIGRKNTGPGQYIDASLFDAALAFSIWDTSEYWGTGKIPEPLGTANRMSAPYQAVRSKDGDFVMGAPNQKPWRRSEERRVGQEGV